MSELHGAGAKAGRGEDALRSIALLGGLSRKARRQLDGGCQWRTYRAGQAIIERGEPTQHVCFLVEGRARVLNYATTGRVVSYATVEAGGFFGELAAIDGRPRAATVVAETDCRIAILPAPRFRQLVASHPEIALLLLKRLAAVIRAGDDRILDLTSLGARERVCLLLLRMAERDKTGARWWTVNPLPSQEMLAGQADTTRQTVFRVLHRLSADGIIKLERHRLCILDREHLESGLLQAVASR